jgi:hypothetical protein
VPVVHRSAPVTIDPSCCHPPVPRLEAPKRREEAAGVLMIGVTGHRILAEQDRLDVALADVVDRLSHDRPEPWTVVSALAEGADRLVARHLLGRPGTRLVAVLPLAVDDYETDFVTPESRAEFRELLTRADEVITVPPQADRDHAYEAGGLAILGRSDVLVAVWDGRVEQGVGGTGAIVAHARERGTTVVWVHAGNRSPGTTAPTSLGPDQGRVTWERFG